MRFRGLTNYLKLVLDNPRVITGILVDAMNWVGNRWLSSVTQPHCFNPIEQLSVSIREKREELTVI